MRQRIWRGHPQITIDPGEFHATKEPIIISTLLGSCVAACLYDPVRKIIGMNHFLLSNKRYSKALPVEITEAGRYGIHSMELLINEMIKNGARKEYLKAKAFGGGNMLQNSNDSTNFFCVGQVNARFIREYLATEKIPLIAADLGGDNGRVIHFSAMDFSVHVRKIQKTYGTEIVQRDEQYWKRSLEKQEKETTEIDLW
ncbi:MAG: chemotaxis protein CheD [SAR324 cluster bacterium]|nr:chemotaxis protein CheD [SAR324 cluster bacterium]